MKQGLKETLHLSEVYIHKDTLNPNPIKKKLKLFDEPKNKNQEVNNILPSKGKSEGVPKNISLYVLYTLQSTQCFPTVEHTQLRLIYKI